MQKTAQIYLLMYSKKAYSSQHNLIMKCWNQLHITLQRQEGNMSWNGFYENEANAKSSHLTEESKYIKYSVEHQEFEHCCYYGNGLKYGRYSNQVSKQVFVMNWFVRVHVASNQTASHASIPLAVSSATQQLHDTTQQSDDTTQWPSKPSDTTQQPYDTTQ